MTISIWRLSHLTLAFSASLFILIASLTGIVLAFEPISDRLQYQNPVALNTVSISETIQSLQQNYDEIITITIDENTVITTNAIDKNGKSDTFYINPKTGEKIGEIIPRKWLFSFATNLHRSLFLKSTGRFLVGFFCFLLFIIALTGIILIKKKQGGFTKIFSKIIKEEFHQYYHTLLSTYFILPIIIISTTGVYLSLEKFSLLPKNTHPEQIITAKSPNTAKQNITDFEVFINTKLDQVKKVEFPFSTDEEDYFLIQTHSETLKIHQFSGQILSSKKTGFIHLVTTFSLLLHTGKGTVLWSLILLLSCIVLIFLLFSGVTITIKRRKKRAAFHNKITKDEAEFVILVGSETGNTIRFATAFQKALLQQTKKVYINSLNSYVVYPKATHLIIFTATYGDGEAPANASNFLKLLGAVVQPNSLLFSVIGFGSTAYPKFCEQAILVDQTLQKQATFESLIPLFKIDNQNVHTFKEWILKWNQANHHSINTDYFNVLEIKKEFPFKVIETTESNVDDTFLITLKSLKNTSFLSGDLLAIAPKESSKTRLYSIAKINQTIVLSIKKHELGICSNYLNSLAKNDVIKASIQKNEHFHFPKNGKDVILIANGTGIAPFLGMIQQQTKSNIHLFWGTRTEESTEIYSDFLEKAPVKNNLTTLKIAYSKTQNYYVQDLLIAHSLLIENTLKNNGTILICGAIAMQKAVEDKIDLLLNEKLQLSVKTLKSNGQIKTDCY